MTSPTPNIHETMGQFIVGNWVSQLVYVAAKLDLATHIAASPKTAAQLAKLTSTHEATLYRVLRALASLGIFAENAQGQFATTPMGDLLKSDTPGSMRAMAIMNAECCGPTWAHLLTGVQTGNLMFNQLHGMPFFDWLSKDTEKAKTFDQAMVSAHGREADAAAKAYDFSKTKTLTDIGGGNGSLITSVLKHHPHIQGTLFDLPAVAERARQNLASAGLAERCCTVGGSFFESIPHGSDTYMMRHIIHDWDDAKSTLILTNTRKAMSPSSKVLILESIVEPGNAPSFTKLLDINMFLIPGGLERTRAQYDALLANAGLKIASITPTTTEISVIEAKPA
jgi:hypothetical protein